MTDAVTGVLEFTILGCGYSGGVPRADGEWGRCDPAEPRNRRSRCSLLVRRKSRVEGALETTVLVDTSPDLRQQAVAAAVTHIDAVVYTHEHADQTHGIDDLRGFYLRHGKRIPCHMDAATHATLTSRFDYVFEGVGGYPAIADAHLIPAHGTHWSIDGPSGPAPITTFHQAHGEINSVGYRFGDVAYSPDVSDMPEASFAALEGLKIWIIDALRVAPHPSHLNLERALDWIARVKPQRAVLTNMFHDLDYAALSARVPPGVEVAYDGLTLETPF